MVNMAKSTPTPGNAVTQPWGGPEVIGRGGSTVQGLQDKSGAHVDVSANSGAVS